MFFTGRIEEIIPEIVIESTQGVNRKIEILINIEDGKYPKYVCVDVWNDRIDNPDIVIGKTVKIQCNLQARKKGDRYFNNITALQIEPIS